MHRLPTERSIVAGWGRNFEEHKTGAGDFANSGVYIPKLQKVDVPVLSGTQCKHDWRLQSKSARIRYYETGIKAKGKLFLGP